MLILNLGAFIQTCQGRWTAETNSINFPIVLPLKLTISSGLFFFLKLRLSQIYHLLM